MTKTPLPTKNSKTKWQRKNGTKNFDYTTIVDQLVWLNRFTITQPSHQPQKLYN